MRCLSMARISLFDFPFYFSRLGVPMVWLRGRESRLSVFAEAGGIGAGRMLLRGAAGLLQGRDFARQGPPLLSFALTAVFQPCYNLSDR